MNKFDREHMDGIGDGLSLALGILRSSSSLEESARRVTSALLMARQAKDRDNLARLRELVGEPTPAPV